jgi:pimeloyl-ACP methyl ester carboxylesterase
MGDADYDVEVQEGREYVTGELRTRGSGVHFVEKGSGEPVLLLHAFPLSSEMWTDQLAALGRQFRAIAVDLPGFGRSPPPVGEVSVASYAEAVLSLVDELRLDKIALVGLSLGGYVAFELFSAAPERLSALALCDTRAEPDSLEEASKREENAKAVESSGIEVLVERMLPNLLSLTASEATRRRVEQIVRAASVESAAGALRAMSKRRDARPLLPRIALPTLVLGGADDLPSPPKRMRAMASAIPGARFVTLARAGHLSNLEQPQAFNAAISGFLEGALRSARRA